MIIHMRHTLWTGISETNVNVITSATRTHAFNNNNNRVPVEVKSSVCVICMKYRIIILLIIIISLGQIILSYMANTSHTHAGTHPPTHHLRRPGCRCSIGRCVPNHDKVNTPFSPVPLAMNGQSVLHSNKQSHMRRGIRDSCGCFSRINKF